MPPRATPAQTVALEASGLLDECPTGVGIYGRGLVRGLLSAADDEARRRGISPRTFRLICPVSRWRRRRPARELGLEVRPYVSGRLLHRSTSIVHLLDTRWPSGYHGPLVATLFDTISALPISKELHLASDRFRQRKIAAYAEIAARADVVITLASAVRDEIVTRFPEVKRVEVIPPGLDVPDERLRAGCEPHLRRMGISRPYLLAVGALCPRKNLESVVAAFDAARRRYPDLQLVLVGAPEYGWAGSAGEHAVRRSPGNVRLTGYLPRETLWAALMKAECVLQLSHYEGYGLTVLEALAAGAPVIASRRGGLLEAGGDVAWLVDPDDREETNDVLERVLKSGSEVESRRARGVAYARSFTWERAGRSVLEVYRQIADV